MSTLIGYVDEDHRRILSIVNRVKWLVVAVIGGALLYTSILILVSSHNLVEWLNTLIATIVSVFSALVIGILLYRYQTTEDDRKKREGLRELLIAELDETARLIGCHRTTINARSLTRERFSPYEFYANLVRHHPQPLIVEEAVKSGLFSIELTTKLQALSRLMNTHQIEVGYAVDSLPFVFEPGPEMSRYGNAIQSVIGSEERVIRGCREVQELVESERP